MTYLNQTNIPLSLAVWLAHDDYDYDFDPTVISATELIRSPRQIILSRRIDPETDLVDISARIASRLGHAIHSSIENAWLNHYKAAMLKLRYPAKIIDRIRINPDPDTLGPDDIPIYMEQRLYKKVGNWTVSGKFDFIGDGRLEDFKSTSTYTYVKRTNDKKYKLQGSIYRWLDPKIITKPEMVIQYIFKDWSGNRAKSDPKYPPSNVLEHKIPLMEIGETNHYVETKLHLLDSLKDADEADLPECTDEDLWRDDPVFKYYKNPNNKARSTKNFDNYREAYDRFIKDGSVGEIIEVKGAPTACNYCAAFNICKQKDQYIADGSLG